jgi:uncharacterized protein YkwD
VNSLRKFLLTATAVLLACVSSTAVAAAATGGGHRHLCQASRGGHAHKRRCGTHARTNHRNRSAARKASAHPASHSGVAGKRTHHIRTHAGRQAGTTVTVSPPIAEPSIASVLATPCQNTELLPETGNLEQIRAAVLCLVNQERARDDELPLRVSSLLEQAAQGHSEAMVSEDYFAHIAPNGETPVDRVQATGYIPNAEVGYTLGENIAWGTLELATPSAIVAAWIASPEHLANILTSAYLETAIGVETAAPPSLANGQPGAVYTQEFGVIVQ